MYMHVYVHTYVYVCICVYTYVCMYICNMYVLYIDTCILSASVYFRGVGG